MARLLAQNAGLPLGSHSLGPILGKSLLCTLPISLGLGRSLGADSSGIPLSTTRQAVPPVGARTHARVHWFRRPTHLLAPADKLSVEPLGWLAMLSSKIELEGELKIPGVLTAGDIAEIRGRWAITRIGRGQVGMVEGVQEVGAELQALRFAEAEVLLQT